MINEIGLVGLGVMGKNIALNLSDKGVTIKSFNDSMKKLDDIKKEFSNEFIGYTNLEEFVESLETPKTILLMVPSGKANLQKLLKKLMKTVEAPKRN